MTRGQANAAIRSLLRILRRHEADLSDSDRRTVDRIADAAPGRRGRPAVEVSPDEIRRAVEQHGSRTAAALNLGISVSTVDRRLRS